MIKNEKLSEDFMICRFGDQKVQRKADSEGVYMDPANSNIDDNIRITVIVAVYNIESYLKRCVDSIIGQTYRNLQIILVDDGSTDKSGGICDSYKEKDSRIEVIHKMNGGLSDARNAGLEKAEGDFVGFVDGDDWIEPFMYKKMLDACLDTGADIAICRYNQIGGSPDWEEPDGKIIPLTKDEAMDLYICGDDQHVIYNSVWSKLFRKSIVGDIRFVTGRNSEDILFTTQTFCNAGQFVYLDIPCYNYACDRAGSIMNEKASHRRLDDEIPFWRMQIGYLHNCGREEDAKKAAYYFYRRMLFYYIDFYYNGQKDSAREIAAQMEADREQINILYCSSLSNVGDRERMKLFLFCPPLYAGIDRIYKKLIVPIKQRMKTRGQT